MTVFGKFHHVVVEYRGFRAIYCMEEKPSFVIRDRRAHGVDGGKPSSEAKKAAQEADNRRKPSGTEPPPSGATPPVTFSSFILSLATSALLHLGEEPDPATGKKSIDISSARQVIDLIALMEEKTKGNLTKDEETMLSQLLYTLRMKFVAAGKQHHV